MMTTSSQEKITDLLNQTGAPFQDWCADIVNLQSDYKVLPEYPYTWPLSSGTLLGNSSTIDFIAARFDEGKGGSHPFREGVVYLVVECKKADSKIKNWVFPETPTHFKESNVFLARGKNRLTGEQSSLQDKVSAQYQITFPNLGYSTQEDFEAVTQGFEINEMLTGLNRDKQEILYIALKQSNLGLRAIANLDESKIIGLDLPPHSRSLYLPVVVTTANLYTAKFDPVDVTVPDGKIAPDKIAYAEKPWVTFQFPLPDYADYKSEKFVKMPTFIVNANHWKNFIKNVHIIYGVE